MPSAAAALGVPGMPNPLGLTPTRHVCVLLVDGLGADLLRSSARRAPFLAGATADQEPLTTGFPSTTAASIGSVGTGRPPGEHGLLGYTMSLPGLERPFNCLRWATYGIGGGQDLRGRFRPERFQPGRTIFETASADGVATAVVAPSEYGRSGLTRAVLRGAEYVGVHSAGDMAAMASRHLRGQGRSLVYAYHSDLDVTGHVRGPESASWNLQLAQVDLLASSLAERLPPSSTLIVTGDHGMVTVPQDAQLDVADAPQLSAGVRMLAGEGRARHVHARPGAAGDVLAAWQETVGDRMWVLPGAEAVARGWFGPRVAGWAEERVGDVVAAAFAPFGVTNREVDPGSARMRGQHGSLTSAEVLVPCAITRRD